VRWGLRLLVLLLPLIILPYTFEPFELGKQFWLLGLGFVLLVVWFSQAVVSRSASIVRSPLHWAVLLLLVVTIIATFTSIDPINSILGFYGRFNGGLVSLIGYLLLFFLITATIRTKADIHWLIGLWLTGIGISGVILFLQLLGLRWLPFAFAQISSFTPLGGALNAVVLILAASFPLAIYFARTAVKSWLRVLSFLLAILIIVLIFMVDYHMGWLGLGLGALCWLGFLFYKNESASYQWTVIPALAILLSVIAWPVALVNITRVSVPVEVNLSLSSSWRIAMQNAKGNPLLGTGPDTFSYGFSKFKPESFNDSNFWAFRFDRATSEFAQLLSTIGFLGLAAYLAVIVLGLYLCWRAIKDRSASDWYLRAVVAASFVVLVAAQVVYFLNTTMAVMTWLTLGLLAVVSSVGERRFSLAESPRTSLSFSFGLAVVVLLAVGVWFGIVRFGMADAAYAKAQQAPLTVDGLRQAQADLNKAVNLNPWRDNYRVMLAQVLLGLANYEASQPVAEKEEDKQMQIQRLQTYIAASIAAARSATELASESVANWEVLGSIYRGTVLFAKDAEPWVISSFEKAVALEPSNPALLTELGRAYLISASRIRQRAEQAKDDEKSRLELEASAQLTKALDQFARAVVLKPDYAPAHFQEVLALELQGKFSDAIDKLERLRASIPQDIDVLYELGSLAYNTGDYNKAEEAFSAITKLVPNHSNAHFSLNLVYQKKGEIDKAIAELEKVLELNPGNQQVTKLLNDLKSGTPPAQKAPAAP
jgi:tetratricopeptide (TPR) repeat protein